MLKRLLLVFVTFITIQNVFAQQTPSNTITGPVRVSAPSGYVDIGPFNEYFTHFFTDRQKFYFDKGIFVKSGLLTSYNSDLTLGTNVGESLTVNPRLKILSSNGNVGIGAELPVEKLHVNGNIHLPKGNSIGHNQGYDYFTYDLKPVGHYSLGWYTDPSGAIGHFSAFSGLRFFTEGQNRMSINKDGSVGIGIDKPWHKLHVAGSIYAAGFVIAGGSDVIVGVSDGRIQGTKTLNRALVHHSGWDKDDNLIINYDGDFEGGVVVNGPRLVSTGNVLIGTTSSTDVSGNSYMLSVNGKVRATEVKVYTNWADFVFEPSYRLRPLSEVESFIKANRHLPEIPSAKEVEANGVDIGETQSKLLQKIEELTLYLIEQNKKLEEQALMLKQQQEEIQELKKK
jgi:hypothetical protein